MWDAQELLPDCRQVVPDRFPDDPAVVDLQQPEHAMAQLPAVPVDVERTARQATRPDVLIEDEVLPVSPSDRDVALVDRDREEVAVAVPDRPEPVDRLVGQADDLVDDCVRHRREDPLDVAVVFRAQLPVYETIQVGASVRIEVLRGVHVPHLPLGR